MKAQDEQEEFLFRDEAHIFMDKLFYLQSNFDEEMLKLKFLPRNFRCQSPVQSYNILDSKDYSDLGFVLERAELILKNPFLVEQRAIFNGVNKKTSLHSDDLNQREASFRNPDETEIKLEAESGDLDSSFKSRSIIKMNGNNARGNS